MFTQFAFPAPFIIPALNEVGFASQSMPARVIEVEPDGKVIAYGYLYFGASGLNQKARKYRYAFACAYHNGELLLECRNCLFEVTSLPIPLDHFRFSGGMTKNGPQLGASLYADYILPADLSAITPASIIALMKCLNGRDVPAAVADLDRHTKSPLPINYDLAASFSFNDGAENVTLIIPVQ